MEGEGGIRGRGGANLLQGVRGGRRPCYRILVSKLNHSCYQRITIAVPHHHALMDKMMKRKMG